MHQKASFTLVELLIVIGILAILTASIVLIINPAQRLKEARDSTRIQELSALEHTISILLTQQDRLFIGTSTYVYTSLPDSSSTCGSLGLPALPPGFTYQCVSEANLRNIDGTGWIPIDFSNTITQIPALPLDPINTTSSGLYYTYMMGGSFELTALMEASKDNITARDDGGSLPGVYETGTHIGLTPPLRDKGLVGYWTFDEGSGSYAYDYSGKGNTGTLTNGPSWQSAANCKVGGCLSFDGVDDSVFVTKSDSLNITGPITLVAWTKVIQDNDDTQAIISRGNWNNSYILAWDALYNKPWVYVRKKDNSGNFGATDSADSLQIGSWYFLAGTYDGTTLRMYTNGVLGPSQNTGEGIYDSGKDIEIGKRSNSASMYLSGSIDESRIYNRALSAAEIQAIYNATK